MRSLEQHEAGGVTHRAVVPNKRVISLIAHWIDGVPLGSVLNVITRFFNTIDDSNYLTAAARRKQQEGDETMVCQGTYPPRSVSHSSACSFTDDLHRLKTCPHEAVSANPCSICANLSIHCYLFV